MYFYILKRIFSLVPVLFVVSIVAFLLIYLTPGDPVSVMLGQEATAEQIEKVREQMGLNEPLYLQYLNWLFNVFQGDLGDSYFMHMPVTTAILDHLGPTLSIAIFAEIIAILIAVPIGILAARHRGSFIDQFVMGFTLTGMAIPSFLFGLLLMLVLGVKLGWLPVAGYQPISSGFFVFLKYLLMPSLALGVIQSALIARMTRSSMLEVLNAEFIKTARSKGLKERSIIYVHAFRNALLPIITVIGQTFGLLIAGAVVIETIFNIPGIGQLVINSIQSRDYAVIQGIILMVAFFYVLINLIIDLLYMLIDPRVGY
ncbi:nickel ABC transporter permease [Bacillus sp. REN16]|uniref:nickel ABC transporter permease n=1 Tax=Bacillus sp. REN16 TaxID=2887296 RepID=UPI001E52C250|nr:nickel ABC transporter permease [Bacillus sp. REN16]MCC3356804.1 ABC transporter permease [Bacillus sp. REN16]